MIHVWRPLWRCTRRPILFFIKENWICAMIRHLAKQNINILLTGNLPFDSDVRQWNHPFMRPLHFLWAKSNIRTRSRFICDVTWFYFCFDFVPSHARCGCCAIVSLRFQFVQKKKHVPKWVLKIWIIINKRHFKIFLDNCTRKSIKPGKSR